MSLLIIGGDLRSRFVADIAKARGQEVYTIGHGAEQEQLEKCNVVLLPIPVAEQDGLIPCALSPEPILLPAIQGLLTGRVWGGRQGAMLQQAVRNNNAEYRDPNDIEAYAIANAYISAEGAIVSALARYPGVIKQTRVLIVGYGRIGRCLSRLLNAWGAYVIVAARNTEQREWALADGSGETVNLDSLADAADRCDILFQTAPVMLINESILRRMKRGSLISDLTRNGADIELANKMGMNAWRDSGIPGRYAPEAAAKIIYEVICSKTEV